MKLESLDDLFGHLLQDLYSAEKQITRALPKLVKAVEDPDLGEALESHLEETKEQVTRLDLDAGLISAAQRVEHYEISAYGTAVEWARLLGYGKAEKLLQQTLEEESAANEKLTMLAEEGINEAAMEGVEVE